MSKGRRRASPCCCTQVEPRPLPRTLHRWRRRRTQLSPFCLTGGTYPIQVRCLTACNGYFYAVVVFEFTKEPDEPFSIGRYIAAVAESQLAKDLGPSAPFQPYQASLRRPVTVITEDGIPPDRYVVGSPAANLRRQSGGPQPVVQLGQGSAPWDPAVWHPRTLLHPCAMAGDGGVGDSLLAGAVGGCSPGGEPSPAVPVALLSPLPSSLKNELEREIPLGTYQYAKSLKDTILLGPNASASSSWAAMW